MQAELQTAPAESADAADAPIGAAEVAQMRRRVVSRVVVDEHGFPADPLEQPIEPVDQRTDIVMLVERRNDDGELRPCPRCRSP
jgi:hypothetical protein